MTQCIQRIDDVCARGLGANVTAWLESLARPSWFTIRGRDRTRTRVVTTLLHGNEPSGVQAIHDWLASDSMPAVDMAFYVGSVQAALRPPHFSHRMLPGARDANRCFRPPYADEDGRLARELLGLVEAAAPEVLVDLHNNTGRSPAYGVGVTRDPAHLRLTSLFGDRFMLSDLSLGTLVEASAPARPSVVIECGSAGSRVAHAVALAGLERLASTSDLGLARGGSLPVEVLHSPVRVSVTAATTLAFADVPVPRASLTLRRGLDRHNFETVGVREVIGWAAEGAAWPFDARGGDGVERSRELLEIVEGAVRTRRPFVPIMMTGSAAIAKQDCLFYAMKRG